MQARLLSWFNGILAKWKALERRHKIGIATVTALILLAFGVTVFLLANPPMKPFYSADNIMDAHDMAALLDAQGIKHKVSSNGLNISIREADLPRAKYEYEMLGAASGTNWTWPDTIGASGAGTSKRIIDQNLILSKQTMIEKQLEFIKGIEKANVILTIPESSSIWMPSGEEPSAAVSLQTNGNFDKVMGDVVARSVARSVMDLKLENIFVTNQYGEVIFSGEVSVNGTYNARNEYQAAMISLLDRNVKNILSPLFSQVLTAPSLQFDWRAVYEETTKYSNPFGDEAQTGYISSEHTIKSSGTNTTPGGEAGLYENNLTTPTYPTGDGETGSYNYQEIDRDYILDVTKSIIENNQTGNVLYGTSSMTVTGIKNRTYKQDNYNPEAWGGLTWEQFKEETEEAVTIVSDPQLTEAIRKATGINDVLLLTVEKRTFEDTMVRPLQIGQIIMLVVGGLCVALLAYALLKPNKIDEITDIEPELSVEDLLVSTQIEEEKEKELAEEERMREIKYAQDSEVKKQIEKFIEERPESAAQLLRNWLNDDWE